MATSSEFCAHFLKSSLCLLKLFDTAHGAKTFFNNEQLITFFLNSHYNSSNKDLKELLLGSLRIVIDHKVTVGLVLSGSSRGNTYICIEIAKFLLKTAAHDHLYLDEVEARNLLHYFVFTSGVEGWFRNSNIIMKCFTSRSELVPSIFSEHISQRQRTIV